jgi:hypothetical protein
MNLEDFCPQTAPLVAASPPAVELGCSREECGAPSVDSLARSLACGREHFQADLCQRTSLAEERATEEMEETVEENDIEGTDMKDSYEAFTTYCRFRALRGGGQSHSSVASMCGSLQSTLMVWYCEPIVL